MKKNNSSKHYNVAVLIPHYNNPNGLYISLKSINHSLSLFVLIVDDGSNERLKPKANEITRIAKSNNFDFSLLENPQNQGIEYALNMGLFYIQKQLVVEHIARLDCEDLMVDNRLDKQYLFLKKNPNIVLVGSYVCFFKQNEELFILKHPTEHKKIIKKMIGRVCFTHPAVMFREIIITDVGYYPTDFPAAEDYAFFWKIIKKYPSANIPEVLTNCMHGNGISSKRRCRQLTSRLKLIWINREFSILFFLTFIKVLLLFIIPNQIIVRLKHNFYK